MRIPPGRPTAKNGEPSARAENPPNRAVKHPARPHKSAIHKRFTVVELSRPGEGPLAGAKNDGRSHRGGHALARGHCPGPAAQVGARPVTGATGGGTEGKEATARVEATTIQNPHQWRVPTTANPQGRRKPTTTKATKPKTMAWTRQRQRQRRKRKLMDGLWAVVVLWAE